MKAKRFLSGIVAMTMVFASVLSVNAAEVVPDQSTEGKGAGEGYVNKYVRDVVVPTNALDFIVDPQGLLQASGKSTSTTKYKAALSDVDKDGNAPESEGLIYFSALKDGKTAVKQTFVDLVVENKSSYQVSVTPKITYTDGKVGKTAMGCSATLNNASIGKSNLLFNLYLKADSTSTGSTDPDNPDSTTPAATSSYEYLLINSKKDNKPVVPNTLNGIAEYYATTFDTKTGYKYALATTGNNGKVYANLKTTDEKKALGNIVTYTLEGSSNPDATNWETVIAKMNTKSTEDAVVVQPSLKITWTITDIKN